MASYLIFLLLYDNIKKRQRDERARDSLCIIVIYISKMHCNIAFLSLTTRQLVCIIYVKFYVMSN